MAVQYPGGLPPAEERPLRELISQLSTDGSLLVQQELALAKTELSEKLAVVKKDAAAMAIGGATLYAGVLALVAAVILLLATFMPAWVSALIVGVLVSGAGAAMVMKGKKDLARVDMMPTKTANSVKADVQMMKEAVR